MTAAIWGAISIICFILYILLFFGGIAAKRVWMVITAITCLITGLITGGMGLYYFSSAMVSIAGNTVNSRTSEEVYAAELGRPAYHCVQIVDYATPNGITNQKTTICFLSCAGETKRILSQRHYDIALRNTEDVLTMPGTDACCSAFLHPRRFGDTLIECLSSEGNNVYTLYISADSSRVYYTTAHR